MFFSEKGLHFSSCNIFCEKLEKKKVLTQASEEFESKCDFMSHDSFKAKLSSILR